MTIYLDNAATSFPKPPRVYETLRAHLEQYGACPGRGSYEMARRAGNVVEETRHVVAELLGIREPQRVIFTLNATDALNMAIKGALAAGGHAVTSVFEHNSVSRPLNRMERDGRIRVSRVAGSTTGLIDPEDVRKALRKDTKLVVIVHGSNVTGALQPIGAIGRIVREHGALFLVDASQTAGAVPIDVEAECIDLLAFPGHKALLGPPGTGGLYVGPRAPLAPWREGGTGVFSERPLQPEELPYALEAGSPNTLGLAGLRESLRFILQYGVAWIRAHELALTERLLQGLHGDRRFTVYGPVTKAERIAVVSLRVKRGAPSAVADFLDQRHHIAVRAGLHCAPGAHRALGTFPEGTLRVSPGYFTSEGDIACLLAGLQEAAEQVTPSRRKGAIHHASESRG